MRLNLRHFLCLLVGFGLLPSAKAQFFEDTWQKFLKEPKTANVSELVMPSQKEQPLDYAKYCLMYATTHFCDADIKQSESKITEIKGIGAATYSTIPGYKERFDDLVIKVAAYHKIEALWTKFLQTRDVTLAEVEGVESAKKVCEKGTLAKCFLMDSYAYYCEGNIAKCKENFEGRVLQLSEKTTFVASTVPGLAEEIKTFKDLFAGLAKLDVAWKKYMDTDVSPGFPDDFPLIGCYPIPYMKVYMLRAAVDVCKNGPEMLKKIKDLHKGSKHAVPGDLQAKIEWLESKVGGAEEDVAVINKAWAAFVPTDKVPAGTELQFNFPCHKDAEIKAYIMDGTMNICEKGKERLADIARVRKESNPTLDEQTLDKLKKLEAKVKKYEDDFATLTKAWGEFLPAEKTATKFVYEYPCHREAEIKAAVMTGLMDMCNKGREMLNSIDKCRKEHSPEEDATTVDKVDKLTGLVTENEKDLADLNAAWKTFTPQDTIIGEYRLVDVYCDKIAQVKSWTIKGHFDACGQGQGYLDKIDALQKAAKLTFDSELACRVLRLRIKVWDCRYWELVRRARKETHEERERFGPESSKIMQTDLNSAKQPCPTSVTYAPIGYIGIKYTIVISLCQNIDVAKMGDPEYYKKIANWVEFQVLQRYCEANMRCKENFFIYLEGHTDGNAFSGASYERSLGIPMGTPFTHFIGKDTLQKTTSREITNSLKSNMELGIARAWSVKQQLDFMKVPITVGAYEHPASEKGGEYRRIEVELNITNLLLDFYEKRLKQLLIESGIGERPKPC